MDILLLYKKKKKTQQEPIIVFQIISTSKHSAKLVY